ncbi:heme-binding protein [Bradyrhizobium diazoefficiens]|nr:heme-binding protein [Bradyrhizobium diazoefficiens]MBR0846454.1 heme-binding protein [Bradyrhizobium diazoefficiens]
MTLLIASICPLRAEESLVTYKSLTPELALELARAALSSCRARGYQVAVAVVDRFGVAQVMLRDRFAGPHTPSTASGKAWTAASFKTSTAELNAISQPGMMQSGLRNLPGVVIIGGGLTVEAGGSLVGAVGVSGAPGGEADEACAKAGIDAIRDKLEF